MKALHSGHPEMLAMLMGAKETFWWPNLKADMVQVRAECLLCNQNVPSQAKEPSMGVPSTSYAFKSLSMDHFFLKGIYYLAIVNRHSGMLSVHATALKGSRELLRILGCIVKGMGSQGKSVQMDQQSLCHLKPRISSDVIV